jgi:hypothetical protein
VRSQHTAQPTHYTPRSLHTTHRAAYTPRSLHTAQPTQRAYLCVSGIFYAHCCTVREVLITRLTNYRLAACHIGDKHIIANNTVFDGSDIGASKASSTFPHGQTETSELTNTSCRSIHIEMYTNKKADLLTRLSGNLFDAAGSWKPDPNDHNQSNIARLCSNPGSGSASSSSYSYVPASCAGKWDATNLVGNWEDQQQQHRRQQQAKKFEIRDQLRDPWNRDFRPCPGSGAATRGAGAYDVYSPTDTQHWIPGAKNRHMASQPSPRDGTRTAATDLDLIFLGAFRARSHNVSIWAATPGASIASVVLMGEDNVAHPTSMLSSSPSSAGIKANTAYRWRVDALLADGTTLRGQEWGFITSSKRSCLLPR